MKPETRELLDLCLIAYLAKHGLRFGTPAALMLANARTQVSPRLTIEEVTGRLDYLGDATNALGKPLVASVSKLSPDLTAWKLTAAGLEYAQERGLDQ